MRYLSPIARVRIADEIFESGDGLLRHAAVTISEDARASNCRIEIYDPGLKIAARYFEMSFEAGGIQVPPDLLEDPNKAKAGGAGTIDITGESGGASSVADASQTPEIKAWLDTIAWAEGTSGADGYNIQFTGAKFQGYDDHPREIKCSQGGALCSDAAGRYQFLSTTWDGLGIGGGFTPENQDKGAVILLEQRGILAQAQQGASGVDAVLESISFEWASLPPYRYAGQGTKSVEQVKSYYAERLAFYEAKGGKSFISKAFEETQAAAQSKEAAQAQTPITDVAETKPVEVSKKGTEIIVELGYNPAQLISFHFIHTGTHTRGRMADSTVFEGQSIRWLMTRRTKNSTYQSISLRELAQRVATAHGVSLEMEGDGPKYAHLDQSGITDYELLLRECRAIGYGIKEQGNTLVLKPRRPEFTGFQIDQPQLIELSFSDKAQKDKLVPPGGSLTTPDVPAGEAKAKINRLTGQVEEVRAEDSTATGKVGFAANALGKILQTLPEKETDTSRTPNLIANAFSRTMAVTGATATPLSGTPAPESAAKPPGEQVDSTTGLPSQKIGAIALSTGTAEAQTIKDEAARVKGYPGSAKVIASPESLTIAPGSIIGISPDCVPDTFAREWRVSSVTHTLSLNGFTTSMDFYTPQAAKASSGAIDITGEQGEVTAPPGKLQNPMPNSPRGTPFDPAGIIRGRPHNGIDLADFGPAKILAAESGTVIDVESSCRVGDRGCAGGFGNLVFIKHDGQWEGWETRYAHLASVNVAIGQTVTKGQIIGTQGNTGASGGDHLHFEALNPSGQRVDPEPLIRPSPTGVYGQGVGTPIRV